MGKTAGLELFTPLFSERYILIHFFLPGGVFNGGILKRALARGISGFDIVRAINGVPMNALDLALNTSAGPSALNESSSIVSQLVTAGATMTGNSRAWQQGLTPHRWKRVHDPAAAAGPSGGTRQPARFEADRRRTLNRTGRVADDEYQATAGNLASVDISDAES